MATENESNDADAVLRNIYDEAASAIMQDTKPDVELLKILRSRIFTLTPDPDAVQQVIADICRLAERRAES